MPFMAKQGNNYEEVETLVDTEGREIDYVLSKVGNTYKRTFTKVRELEDAPPLEFKSIKPQANLLDYRIYGQTENGESVGDRTGNLFDGEVVQGGLDGGTGAEFDSDKRCRSSYILLDAGTYTISISSSHTIGLFIFSSSNVFETFVSYSNSPITFSLETVKKVRLGFSTHYGNVSIIPSDISNIMLNTGSTALPYEPYGYKVPVTVEGKNLLQNTATGTTTYGVTLTVNSDGSVTCNGTATSTIIFPIFEKELGQNIYILSGCPENGAQNERYKMQINPGDGWYADIGNGLEFEIQNTSTIKVRLVIYPSYTCNNLTFYPMIRKADIEDDTYEPYRTPVTTPIYLPEQIRKVGDEEEYIDYGQQKQHRVRKNLFDGLVEQGSGIQDDNPNRVRSKNTIFVTAGKTYTFSHESTTDFEFVLNSGLIGTYPFPYNDYSHCGTSTEWVNGNITFTATTNGYVSIVIRKANYGAIIPSDVPASLNIQFEEGTTATEYEPYITNTELDVTLPALPTVTGTNVLSVGTEVQPSEMYIKGNIKGGGAA